MENNLIPLEWHTEQRRWIDLVPYEHNPRKMNAAKRKKLEESYHKFNNVEIPAINLNNTLVAGHQRATVNILLGKGEELTDVRVPNRLLTELELKEYIVASNAIKGDWLDDILSEQFGDIDLMGYGLDINLSEELEQQIMADAKAKSSGDPVYSIVAQFSEKHDAIIIVSNNEIDTNHIKELLGLERNQSYKSDAVGQSHVITGKDFIRKWNSKLSS